MIKACLKSLTFIVCAMLAVTANAAPGEYQGPADVEASADGKALYVLCSDAKQIAVVDIASAEVKKRLDCPATPTGIALSPDGKTLFVTCAAPEGSVGYLDLASGKFVATVKVGHWAIGPSVSPCGKKLYVCNRFDNDVSVIDVAAKKVVTRVATLREPISSAVSPDGELAFISNHLAIDPADGYDVASEVTIINAADNKTTVVRLPNGSSSLREVCVAPDGKYAYVAHILSRYQMPTTQLERGWMNTNAMSIIDVATKKLVNTVLLDEIDLGASNPWAVACTADSKFICVTHAGTHEVSVIDADAMMKKLADTAAKDAADKKAGRYPSGGYRYTAVANVPNDLAFLVGLRRRIRVQGRGLYGWLGADRTEANGPRGMAVIGTKLYIAAYFSDKIAVVDLEAKNRRDEVVLIPVGPQPELTMQREGEIAFHDAWLCFQHWQSCASCHPDARVDALNWDLMNDGLGNPKNARSMLLAHKTPPAMSSAIRATGEEAVRAGFTHILFAVHPEEIHVAVDEYLKALKPIPSPALVNGELSEAAKRGKELFFSDRVDCAQCHPAPLYTDLELYNVGTRGQYDRRDTFDTPSLIECWRTAPYMHDGHYTTLKEVLTEGKHGQTGGVTLTDKEIADLVEFVKSL
jgi:YVTN family beta-propeller protein